MSTPQHQLDVLFVSENPLWPMDQGYRVHGSNMAKTLTQQGLKVGIATIHPAQAKIPGWLQELTLDWPAASATDIKRFALGWSGKLMGLRDRLAGHQDLHAHQLAGVLPLVEQTRPRAIVALGPHGPALLRGLAWAYPKLPRVWYAADEPAGFQLSMLRREGITALPHRARLAAVFALMQIAFNRGNRAHRTAAAIGVSPHDTRWLGRLGGCNAVNIPNGVDTDYFQPDQTLRLPRTCVFWGNLSFEPNIDAVRWFARKVWTHAVYRWPDATWTIIGRSPRPEVYELADLPGVEVLSDVSDIRPHVLASSAAVMPMRCGRGIKNKLLEAAAMGMPILASKRAKSGLIFGEQPAPMMSCSGASTWVDALDKVWHSPARARALGDAARSWVLDRHTWGGAAMQMQGLLQGLMPGEDIYPPTQTQAPRIETPSRKRKAA
ncbi:MAG: glycosyltransferase family 4 protein [Phycisphaerales bacterium JB063]